MEDWKEISIIGLKNYEISNLGNIRNSKTIIDIFNSFI